jgi:argininosuccinate lyase
MIPELIEWSSSLALDRALVREDLLGSAAHVTMLGRTGLVGKEDAAALRGELLAMLRAAEAGTLALPDGEEDVHMAVESELARKLGAVAGRLHTARSRNDQVATDLHLHVRDQAAVTLAELVAFGRTLLLRAANERDIVLPAYTHRQRAQPVSAAFLVAAWAAQLARAGECIAFTLDRVASCPLGSGACSGSSLPIDRALVADLLGFARPSTNALDTVGDRDFALDWTWAGARTLLALGKLASDVVDFSTAEFGLVRLDGEIAAGSSMMPQKKNPDIFELVRGKAGRGIGNVVSLLTLVKGLPSGYNRDQQEDRQTLLETAPLVRGSLRAVSLALPHVHFVPSRGGAALAEGFTQATDLAEALVRKGVPFREAYKAVGELVRRAIEAGRPLAATTVEDAKRVHDAFDRDVLAALDPHSAVRAKESVGGTGPNSVSAQIEALTATFDRLDERARQVPSLRALADRIEATPMA